MQWNWWGVKNKLRYIKHICNEIDVILQETWLMPYEIDMMNGVHDNFAAVLTSSVDPGVLLMGQPYGGLTILWWKSLVSGCESVFFDDHMMLGIKFGAEANMILLMNVYLPYNKGDNIDDNIL